MRAELKGLIEALDGLEKEGADGNKIDDFFRLILLGENSYIARYLSDLKETQDWLLFSDVVMALEQARFFEFFPRKKWVVNMVRGSWDRALKDALEEEKGEEEGSS